MMLSEEHKNKISKTMKLKNSEINKLKIGVKEYRDGLMDGVDQERERILKLIEEKLKNLKSKQYSDNLKFTMEFGEGIIIGIIQAVKGEKTE